MSAGCKPAHSSRVSADRGPAVVLLSGGLDSATAAALARQRGHTLLGLTIAYGQRHAVEVQAARSVAAALSAAEHVVQHLDLRVFGGSALTAEIAVPKGPPNDATPAGSRIPVTYVPARNTIFLALALAFAESRGASDIFIGVNAVDYSGYPDCRPVFIAKFQELARLATRAGIEGQAITIHAPLIDMTKAQIIRTAHELGVDLSLTTSCYDPGAAGHACGACESCLLRRRGFAAAGLPDPTRYGTGIDPPAV